MVCNSTFSSSNLSCQFLKLHLVRSLSVCYIKEDDEHFFFFFSTAHPFPVKITECFQFLNLKSSWAIIPNSVSPPQSWCIDFHPIHLRPSALRAEKSHPVWRVSFSVPTVFLQTFSSSATCFWDGRTRTSDGTQNITTLQIFIYAY